MTNLVFSIYNCLQVQKRASSERGRGSFGLLEAMEATISKNLEAGKEMLLFPATSTQAERLFSWMGFLHNKRRLPLSGEGMSIAHAAFPQ